VAALIVTIFAGLRNASFREVLESKTVLSADRLAESLALPLYVYILEACDNIITSEMKDADFSAIFLKDKAGALIMAAGRISRSSISRSFTAEEEGTVAAAALARSSRPVAYHGDTIGIVTIYAAGSAGFEESRRRLLEEIALALIEGVSVALLAFVMVDRFISRRILGMGAEIARFTATDLSARASDARSDEIGDLAAAFNAMADTIQGYARGLEDLVAKRTGELEGANAELVGKNKELVNALAELTTTQDRLVETRRVAALGQLVAGIAHQLNTPLGAIISANRSIGEEIGEHVSRIAAEFVGMERDDVALLEELLEASAAAENLIDFALLRVRRREIHDSLQRAGYANPAELAETIVDAKLYGLGSRLDEILANKRIAGILTIVQAVASIRTSAMVVATASEKAANVIRALRVYLGQAPGEQTTGLLVCAEVEAVLGLFRHLTRSGVELVTRFDRACGVRGRRDQLDLVWMNLIDNALQSMDGRGKLEIVVERSGSDVLISIADDGPGIPPEYRARIFDPFFTTKPQGGGMGLGLNTAKKIIEDHGGGIHFQSAEGRTVFVVRLAAEEGGRNP
jgi:signal transduction histidine kinase